MGSSDLSPGEQILHNVSRYITLDAVEADLFLSSFRPAFFRRKQLVLREGETARFTSFVCRGCLRSYFQDDNGFAHVLQFAVEDWWIGDMYSLMYHTPSQLNIDALEPTDVMQLHQEDLEILYAKIPKLERFFRILSQKSMANLQQRMIGNLSQTALERYLDFRNRYSFLEARLPQHQIASFLGMTPEFLSMIRKKLSKGSAR